MTAINNNQLLLGSIIGAPVIGVQVPVDTNLPVKLPQNIIHYELYKNHVDFHIESSSYPYLCDFLKEHLPNNDIAECVDWNKFGYRLKRRIEGWNNIKELGEAIIELRSIVEPVLLCYCEKMAYNIDLAHALGQYYEKQKVSLPFHINVIDQLHADENAHTRILAQLLKYREDGKYTIMKSFLKLLPEFDVDSFNIDKSQVFFNRENIDGLIEKEGEYAVIIENKSHWAVDQDKQIERYVDTEINHGIPQENIWVIYLTRDGQKKVEKYSLTQKTKKILGSRFVELDYRNHILPWLKDSILPNCRMKEEWLASAIKQYVDHLEGLFGTRESQKKLINKMKNEITNRIGCSDTMSIGEKYINLIAFAKTLNDMQSIVGNYIDSLVNPVVSRLKEETLQIFGDLCPNSEVEFNNRLDNGYFQIRLKNWDNLIHFEWFPLNIETLLQGNVYTFTLHMEGNWSDKMRRALEDETFCKEAEEAGLKLDSDNKSVTFYCKKIETSKSIAKMSQTELQNFLREIYEDVNKIQTFVTNRFLTLN